MVTDIDWKFLTCWTPELAWWWGAFLGDGSAPSDGYVVHITGAHTTVWRWRALLAPGEKRPLYETPNSPGTFRAVLNSRPLSDWVLTTHGIRGPKSATLPWPEDLPRELLPHFVRGLWDTDGHLSIRDRKKHEHRGNPQPIAAYRTQAKAFLDRLRDVLAEDVGVPRPALTERRYKVEGGTRSTWLLSYGGTAAMRVADYLYGSAPEHLRNEDRQVTYAKMCALRNRFAEACACGKPKFSEDLCRSCHRTAIGRKTGPGTACSTAGCGKPVLVRGVCAACRSRARRAATGNARASSGPCPCGVPAYRKGLCDACYERRRRGRPTRFEAQATV